MANSLTRLSLAGSMFLLMGGATFPIAAGENITKIYCDSGKTWNKDCKEGRFCRIETGSYEFVLNKKKGICGRDECTISDFEDEILWKNKIDGDRYRFSRTSKTVLTGDVYSTTLYSGCNKTQ